MDIEQKIDLVKQVGEEIITEPELRQLFETKDHPIAYDGFEPSGKPHIAQGLLRAINVNKMLKAGVKFKMYAADWHAWTNLKFGGDLNKIQIAGDYLVEVWKACGMDVSKVQFIRAVDVVDDQEYWKKVMRVAQVSTVKRITRCGQIMGRNEEDVLQASQIIYPCMQCADVFEFEVDITQLGMDQRKVNMLAREVAPELGYKKPIVVSHHMLMGLTEPKTDAEGVERAIAMKMSKSNPASAIFMTDTQNEIFTKINKAYCPDKQIKENPVLEYCKYIVFEKFKTFDVERSEKFGGNISFGSYDKLEKTYVDGKLHPMDLKQTTAKYVDKLIEPVRSHFEKNKKAKELLEKVNSYMVKK